MPEKTSLSRMEKAYSLQDARDNNQYISIRCYHCNITRNYLPKDLILLLGVIPVYWLPAKMRCEGCKRIGHLKEGTHSFTGSDYGKLPMRRLKNVRFVREVSWDDGVL